MNNLVRFVELLVKIGDCKIFKLETKPGETPEDISNISKGLKQLQETLEDLESNIMKFEYFFNDKLHDRSIRTSNNWEITLDRGLHFYQNMNPNKNSRNYFQMGTYDLDLRPCLQTKFVFAKRNIKE